MDRIPQFYPKYKGKIASAPPEQGLGVVVEDPLLVRLAEGRVVRHEVDEMQIGRASCRERV